MITTVVKAGGNVLTPAFDLGRAPEILLALRTSAKFCKLVVPVYANGLLQTVTDTFEDHIERVTNSRS